MSDYRDDTVETAVIADDAWGGFKGRMIEDYGYLAAALLVSISVLHTDQATAADAVIDRQVGVIVEQAAAHDEAPGSKRGAQTVTESGAIADRVFHRTRAVLTETAAINDDIRMAAAGLVIESAIASDTATGVLHASGLTRETGRLSDSLVRHANELVAEVAAGSDSVSDRLRARVMLVETATIGDEALSAHAAAGHINETAALSDEAHGLLRAVSLTEEVALADASLVSDEVNGQAWVSEADNWAMSRYAPFGFQAATVVDGVVYLAGPGGLYALDGTAEPIEARLQTGKIDTGGTLSRPLNAYLEYTMDGTASVEVVQTQGGQQEQPWAYPLERGSAAVLTNGRVTFGRGLRGRHFAFALNLSAKQAYINDMAVVIEPGSRRI